MFLSRIPSFEDKEGQKRPGFIIKDNISFGSLKDFFDSAYIEDVDDKHDGFALSPARFFKYEEILAAAKAPGATLSEEDDGEGHLTVTLEVPGKAKRMFHFRWSKSTGKISTRRKDDNVRDFGGVILDFDEYDPATPLIDRIKNALVATGWAGVIQSSFNHGVNREGRGTKQGYHVFLELTRRVKKGEWPALFQAVVAEFAKHGANVDGTTSDLSRLYFGVCKNKACPQNWHWEYVDGCMLDADDLHKKGEPIARQQAFQKAEARRYDAAKHGIEMPDGENPLKKIRWGEVDMEGLLDHLGLEHTEPKKARTEGHAYTMRFNCGEEHGGADDAVCSWTPGEPPMVYCSHDTCPIGKGPGSTARFFARHFAKLPAELVNSGEITFERKKRPTEGVTTDRTPGMPKIGHTPLAEEGAQTLRTPPVGDGCTIKTPIEINGISQQPQPESTDPILDILKRPDKIQLLLAPTGGGKSHNAALYALGKVEAGEKVCYVASTKAEMKQFQSVVAGMRDKAWMYTNVHMHQSGNTDIPKKCMLVVTHHHFLIRAGITSAYYPLVEWLDGVHLVIDELDALLATCARSIPVSLRYVKGIKGDKIQYRMVCPSRGGDGDVCKGGEGKGRRYQCNNCMHTSQVPLHEQHTVWAAHVPSHMLDVHEFMHPAKFDSVLIPAMSALDPSRTVVVHDTSMHTLSVTPLVKPTNYTKSTVRDSNNLGSYASAPGWITTLLGESDHPHLVSTNDDLSRTYTELYNKFYNELDMKNVKLELGEELDYDSERRQRSQYANKCMSDLMSKKELRPYPHHPCGTADIHYQDTYVLRKAIERAASVRMMTGTMSESKMKLAKEIGGKDLAVVTKGHSDFVPISKLTVVVMEQQLSAPQIDAVLKSRITKPVEVGKYRVGKTLVLMPTKDGMLRYLEQYDDVAHYDQAGDVGVYEKMAHGKWDTLLAYSRSPLGRGMNLGDFSTVIVDANIVKPMFAYDLTGGAKLQELQAEDMMAILVQNSGRIMRRSMHYIDGKWETVDFPHCHERVVVIHGFDWSCRSALQKAIETGWQHLVADPIQVIEYRASESLGDDLDTADVTWVLQSHWEHGVITKRPFEIPEKFLKVGYARACRMHLNYGRLVTKERHEEMTAERADMEWLREVMSKEWGPHQEFCRDTHWYRRKTSLCKKALDLAEEWIRKMWPEK